MTKNNLELGESRVGYAWDAKIAEPYPAMLRHTPSGVELIVPFESEDVVLKRRYVGADIKWGDDPDLVRYDYELPDHFWFCDAHGFVSLVGVRGRIVNPLAGGPTTLTEATIRIRYAVFTLAAETEFCRINGLNSRIEGFARWFGHTSVSNNLQDADRPSDEITVTFKTHRKERIDRRLNLSVVTGPDWSFPGGPGLTSIEDACYVRTEVTRPRTWAEHVDMHIALQQLVQLSAWSPVGFERVSAMHLRDPERVLSGREVGKRWSRVLASALPGPSAAPKPDFLFGYDDIGAVGVRRWLDLRAEFNRGISAMTFGIGSRDASLDGLLSDCGIGLENIGYRLQVARAVEGRRSHENHLRDVAREVQDLLPFKATTWARDSANMYNGIKHPDRQFDPPAQEMYAMLVKNRLVFRLWVARRIGVSDAVINRGMWRLEKG